MDTISNTLGKLAKGVENIEAAVNDIKNDVKELDVKVDKLDNWKAKIEGKVGVYMLIIGLIMSIIGWGLGRLFF